jgi:hypothetical protein
VSVCGVCGVCMCVWCVCGVCVCGVCWFASDNGRTEVGLRVSMKPVFEYECLRTFLSEVLFSRPTFRRSAHRIVCMSLENLSMN